MIPISPIRTTKRTFALNSSLERQQSTVASEEKLTAGCIGFVMTRNFPTAGSTMNTVCLSRDSQKVTIVKGPRQETENIILAIRAALGVPLSDLSHQGNELFHGLNEAAIRVVFWNKGPKAFQPEKYPNYIKLERYISSSETGSNMNVLSLGDDRGNIFVDSRVHPDAEDTLKDMLRHFQIQLNHPLFHVDLASIRHFDLYQMFAKAHNLDFGDDSDLENDVIASTEDAQKDAVAWELKEVSGRREEVESSIAKMEQEKGERQRELDKQNIKHRKLKSDKSDHERGLHEMRQQADILEREIENLEENERGLERRIDDLELACTLKESFSINAGPRSGDAASFGFANTEYVENEDWILEKLEDELERAENEWRDLHMKTGPKIRDQKKLEESIEDCKTKIKALDESIGTCEAKIKDIQDSIKQRIPLESARAELAKIEEAERKLTKMIQSDVFKIKPHEVQISTEVAFQKLLQSCYIELHFDHKNRKISFKDLQNDDNLGGNKDRALLCFLFALLMSSGSTLCILSSCEEIAKAEDIACLADLALRHLNSQTIFLTSTSFPTSNENLHLETL